MGKKYCPYCMSTVNDGETCKNCGLTEGAYMPRDHHLPLRTILNNRYLVGRVLGEGGFGITYIGCDLNLELKVAIKEYFPIDQVYRLSKTSLQVSGYSHAEEKYQSGKTKFLREARLLARLDKQQNIVSVRDFFEENGTAYIVMEYLEGITLKEMVRQKGRIPVGELLHMLEPLFSALTSIHEMGLIHRDISPDNLMLENGKIKLLDFGCARDSAVSSETMTIALKQGFAPIEQYQHKGQGPWTDVYALSATIYYCLTGKILQSAVDRLYEDELVPPGRLGVDLAACQEEALLHGLNVRAKDRFKSVEELYTALYKIVKSPQVSYKQNSVPAEAIFVPDVPISASNAATPASDPDLKQNVHKDYDSPAMNVPPVDNKTVAFDSAVEFSAGEPSPSGTDEEAKSPAKGGIRKAFETLKQRLSLMIEKRRNLVILGGGAVLLAAVVCIVYAAVLPRLTKETSVPGEGDSGTGISGTDNSGGDVLSGEDPQQEDQPDSRTMEDILKELESIKALFADAAVLESFTEEEIQRLMEDDAVTAVRVSEAARGEPTSVASTGAITITKPMLVEENAYIGFHDMVTLRGENACLWIQGDVLVNCILQTADGGRIVVDNSDFISIDTLWLDKEADVLLINDQNNLYDKYPPHGHLIIGGKNTLFRNPVSVSDEASLRQAVDGDQAIIICDDITIDTELYFHTPVMIEEGATVSMGEPGCINVNGNGAFLWNEGRIQGGLLKAGDMGIINYGEINDGSMMVNGTIVNMGNIMNGSFYDDNGDNNNSILNIGTLRFQSEGMSLSFGLTNYGTVTFSSTHDGLFTLSGSSSIDNYGEIRVEDGSVLLLSYLCNIIDGRITVCDNAVLDNDGVIILSSAESELVCDANGTLMNEQGAVYYFDVTPAYLPEDGWWYLAYDVPHVCEVSNIDELTAALQDPDVDNINLTGEIRWDDAAVLILTKDVDIAGGAGLLMAEGSELILDGCFLLNSGYLKADALTLIHGGGLRNYNTLELYSPESVIKLGNVQGERDYNGTDCLLNHGSILNGCAIELYDSGLMIQNGFLEGNMLQIRDHAYFANVGEIQWIDGSSIEISNEGRLHNLLPQEWFRKMTIHIAEGGIFENYDSLVIQSGDLSVEYGGLFGNLTGYTTFGNDLSVLNYGFFSLCPEAGQSTVLQGYFENHGTLHIVSSDFVIDTPYKAANPACLNNQGEVRVSDPNGHIRSDNGEFIGNEPTYGDWE